MPLWTDIPCRQPPCRVYRRPQASTVAVAAKTEATTVRAEDSRMASMLGKRRRSRPDRAVARPVDDVAQAERAAMTALTETLRRLAADLSQVPGRGVRRRRVARR